MQTMPDFDSFSGGDCTQVYKLDAPFESYKFGENTYMSYTPLLDSFKDAGCDARLLVYSEDNELVFVDKNMKKYNRPKGGATNLQVEFGCSGESLCTALHSVQDTWRHCNRQDDECHDHGTAYLCQYGKNRII